MARIPWLIGWPR